MDSWGCLPWCALKDSNFRLSRRPSFTINPAFFLYLMQFVFPFYYERILIFRLSLSVNIGKSCLHIHDLSGLNRLHLCRRLAKTLAQLAQRISWSSITYNNTLGEMLFLPSLLPRGKITNIFLEMNEGTKPWAAYTVSLQHYNKKTAVVSNPDCQLWCAQNLRYLLCCGSCWNTEV